MKLDFGKDALSELTAEMSSQVTRAWKGMVAVWTFDVMERLGVRGSCFLKRLGPEIAEEILYLSQQE